MLPSIDHKVSEGLALNTFEVVNFRAFESLTIPRLARVNLITGKNNVGKSALLEAVQLYASSVSPITLQRLLVSRDELSLRSSRNMGISGKLTFNSRAIEQAVQHLFYNRPNVDGTQAPFCLGPVGNPLIVNVEWLDRVVLQESDNDYELRPIENYAQLDKAHDPSLYLTVKQGSSSPTRQYTLVRILSRNIPSYKELISSEYVDSYGVTDENLGSMWDAVVATPTEDIVLEALRILHPAIERLVFVAEDEGRGKRVPLVKSAEEERVPLRSFGEGMCRVLGIILGLTTVGSGGILLIDEIESGLHYSMMPDFWNLVFRIAGQLNVQIFTTTHSWDCIEAFQNAAAESEDEGILIRLQNKAGNVRATVFDEEDLQVITRDQIEVR